MISIHIENLSICKFILSLQEKFLVTIKKKSEENG